MSSTLVPNELIDLHLDHQWWFASQKRANKVLCALWWNSAIYDVAWSKRIEPVSDQILDLIKFREIKGKRNILLE